MSGGDRRLELEVGSIVAGYRVDALISRGGMGVVYRATNVALGRIYALKVLAPELANDEHFRERFKREIRIAASLHHPNVVEIHYAGEQDGLLFVAMDLIDGGNLTEVIAQSGRLDPERTVGLLEQIAAALDAAHSKGLVHRDVKPANILVRIEHGQEHAYLTDFGLAKRFDAPTALTLPGAVVGTVDYMPPEQITGHPTDARSDIYAVGCVLFQMLTGEVPYRREHSVATLFAHLHDPPPPLEGSAAGSHPTFGPVIAKAMAKDPADRYLSAGDLARDAAAALHGARFSGPPTIVGTGDARPVDVRDDHPAQPDQPAQEVQAAQEAQPAQEVPPTQEVRPAQPAQEAREAQPAQEAQEPQEAREPQGAPPVMAQTAGGAAVDEQRGDLSVRGALTRDAPPAAAAGAAGPPAMRPPAPRRLARSSSDRPGRRRRWIPVAALAGLVAVGAVVAVVATSGSSKKNPPPTGTPFGSALRPVPTNRVTASGTVTVRLVGDLATVTINAHGLLSGAPHAMHIHAGGRGVCPPASAARLQNGHLTISTTDGIIYYGDTVVSLTTVGDTSPRSIIDFTRYPTSGTIDYHRAIRVSAKVAAEIRDHNAVVVIHGIDYNGNGVYDNVLDRSDLSNALTGESTAPALCGSLGPQAGTATSADSTRGGVYTASLGVHEISMSKASMFWCAPSSPSSALQLQDSAELNARAT